MSNKELETIMTEHKDNMKNLHKMENNISNYQSLWWLIAAKLKNLKGQSRAYSNNYEGLNKTYDGVPKRGKPGFKDLTLKYSSYKSSMRNSP